ncbi:hypothetical protein Lgra_1970 [Legionella gratiana]|uniref:Phasin protein n=1 Tax=Legionella gratiana TaxID=45066 RepID=A0A378JA28_9GAMM|nr:hypothetical protein [Legionella gratiana]KTD11004.1 hypothetical protein Lgra_1970 [Legionella gratiana]STX44653.1 Uncharacterised protein [Legionella gratiana]
MKNQFFDQKIFNNLDAPIQKLMELNVKMMQNLSYMKPMDLLSVKKPEEIFEKQIELFVQNSNMMIDYMRTTFGILENHWLNVSRNFDQSPQKMMKEAYTTAEKSAKKTATAAKSSAKKTATKKSAPTEKKSVSTAKKTASSIASANTKKDTKAAKVSKNPAPKSEKKKAKSTTSAQTKTSVIHAKEPISQGTPTGTTNENIPVNTVTEKSSTQDLNVQKH